VTVLTLHLDDPSRPTISRGRIVSSSRALTTLVWVPQVAGRRPLVVFGHGFQVGPGPYEALLRTWASHGYVVAAPEFPLTDTAVAGANLDEADIDNQPADLRFVTDALVAPGGPVADRIATGEVAVAGHSDGAESALAASLAATPPGQPQFRALIAMSVQELPGVTRTANPPLLITQGDVDNINPPAYGYQTWQYAASPKFLVVLHGAGHLPPLEPGSAWLPRIETATLAFLDCYVAHDGPESAIQSGLAGSPLFSVRSG
jgi:pimeloyl-ACP methyl ester carboxylesterase